MNTGSTYLLCRYAQSPPLLICCKCVAQRAVQHVVGRQIKMESKFNRKFYNQVRRKKARNKVQHFDV